MTSDVVIHVPHANRERIMALMLRNNTPVTLGELSSLVNMGYERVRRAVASLVEDKLLVMYSEGPHNPNGRQPNLYRITNKAMIEADRINEYMRSIATLAPTRASVDQTDVDRVVDYLRGRKDRVTVNTIANETRMTHRIACNAVAILVSRGVVIKHVSLSKTKKSSGRRYSRYSFFNDVSAPSEAPRDCPEAKEVSEVAHRKAQAVSTVCLLVNKLRPHCGNPFGPMLAMCGVDSPVLEASDSSDQIV